MTARAPASSLRIALLSYRSHPRVGGQGVYVRYLSRALRDLGHRVDVLSGQPYPDLDDGVGLVPVPSLDLYRDPDPFRRPRLHEFRGGVDLLEYAAMCAGSFPEPLTFSLRAARVLARSGADYDVVHDNQCLGYGLLRVARRHPVVATVHHPITIDRRLALEGASSRKEELRLRRWFSFCSMQARVARRLDRLVTVSRSAAQDVAREFRVAGDRITTIPNGVDAELFRPLPGVPRSAERVLAVVSSDLPMKGVAYLVEAVAKLRTEREVELVLVGKGGRAASVRDLVARFDLSDCVSYETDVEPLRLVELYAGAAVAVVPSLYEGFSLPAVEAMSCEVPLVATTGGALPEVVGRDGEAALVVPPADAEAIAAAVRRVLDDRQLAARLGASARARVLSSFTWEAAARALADLYREAAAC